MNVEDHSSFVTTSKGMAGWFAVLMWWNDKEEEVPDGFWEPWNTGIGRYATKEEAEVEGRQWAASEEVEFRP